MSEPAPSGLILIDKPNGVTSFDVVSCIKKLYKTKRVGHTGTLDPLATGLLCVLVGSAVKASDYLLSDEKTYIAGMRLGITTDTEDITGKVLSESDVIPDNEAVIKTAKSFVGEYMQTPPMYSALKLNGKKLYEYAREGIEIDREPRKVEILSMDISGNNRDYNMVVSCSKGTYIRTLCSDIGTKLGCGAVMSSLRRTKCGNHSIENAHTLEELKASDEIILRSFLMPPDQIFSNLPKVSIHGFFEKLCLNGCEIYQKKINTSFETGTLVSIYGEKGLLGIGRVSEYEEGSAIKLITRFV
ncbi:MAG: tRNA pseudouridine(55) synthase TruB [Clostridiales bacterium]|nr:tRNA pseudouridine(55) synthase TruB [Clostridiales bacterium]